MNPSGLYSARSLTRNGYTRIGVSLWAKRFKNTTIYRCTRMRCMWTGFAKGTE